VTELGDLRAKKLSAKLPEDTLKERIATLFKEQTMCTIATASSDGQPRATPLECFADGMTLYIFADPGTKIENIKVNPKVSISVCNQINPSWKGDAWKGIKAAQITGVATILQPDDPESIRARKEVILEYSESALLLKGYSSKQIWEA
jgi:nitroimidazol reductase NimA-like FMN-containing flavoprotein (pyridoxamine 5'-phosphate oxidase superfamily)